MAQYWQWLGTQAPEWWNHGVMFGGPSTVLMIDRIRWQVTFNVHVTRLNRRSKPYVSAVLSVVPIADVAQRRRIRHGQWVRNLGRSMKRHGYSGGWRDSRGGAAMWFKELPNLAALQTEVAQVRRYDVRAMVSGSRGRRTRS
jgi:hypothetical protein